MVEKIGGHNPAEAANFGKAVVMGPYTEKCNAQINDLVGSGGGIKLKIKIIKRLCKFSRATY